MPGEWSTQSRCESDRQHRGKSQFQQETANPNQPLTVMEPVAPSLFVGAPSGAGMTFELIDIAVRDKQAHPRLTNRTTGHVRAVLTESQDGRLQTHELAIAVWADLPDGSSEGDVDMALMLKAATIIARVKSNLDRPT